MFTRILVPLDGSQWSERVLPYACLIADAFKIEVELLQMIDPDLVTAYSDPEHGRYVDIVSSTIKEGISKYLRKSAGLFANATSVTCSAEIGKAAEVIVDKAAAYPDGLIAMSTHGRSGIHRWLLGSIADKILHGATNPLLLVRPNGKIPSGSPVAIKKIFVPLDGSPLAELTLPHARELTKTLSLEMVLVRAYDPMAQGHIPYAEHIQQKIREEAKSYLEEKVRQMESEGLKQVSYFLPQGNAAEKIVDIARATPDSMIAICSHGRSGIGRWVLGSVTDHVVSHCGNPVLVIRAPH